MGRQTGIRVRHSRSCRSLAGGRCSCRPTYEAAVFDARANKKIRRPFPTEAAARQWRVDAMKALREGTLSATLTEKRVSEACDEWLELARSGEALTRSGARYKPKTLRVWQANLEAHVYPYIGDVRLADLRRSDVQKLVDRLNATHLSGSSVRNCVMPLRCVCRHAIRRDELIVNPTSNLELPETAGVRDRVATPDEAELLIELAPPRWQAFWATAFYGGLRLGELRALRWLDFGPDLRVINVARGWDDKEGEIAPKSRKSTRSVPVPPILRKYLLAHRALTGRRSPRDLVFGQTASRPFTTSWVRRQTDRAWAAAVVGAFFRNEPLPIEIDLITPHECRHTYVTLMHEAGLSLERIGDYVGHDSSYMTERYRHLLKGHEEQAAELFDSYLTGARTGAHPARKAW